MKKTYRTLDALRGIAALAVVIFHGKWLLGWNAIPSGYLAVDFFFVLSGFVIAHAYDSRLASDLSSGRFIWHRIARFYPLYILGFGIGLLYELGLVGMHNPAALSVRGLLLGSGAAALFLPFPYVLRDGNLFAFNVPSWSLFYELVVNAAYALLFRVLSVPVLIGLVLINGAIFGTAIALHGTGDFGALADQVGVAIPRTIFSFSVGLLIYRLKFTAPKIPIAIIVSLMIGPMIFPVGPAVTLAFVFVISPLVVLLGSAVEPGDRTRKAFEFLGLISFPIYAIHRPVLSFAQTLSQRLHISPVAMMIAVIVALAAISPLIEQYYDKPARKLLDRLTRKTLVDRSA